MKRKEKNKVEYDCLIVGAGLFGCVLARELTDSGKKILVIEKRGHIGGNIFTEDIGGIQVHRYGAHIFHTDDINVWNYVNRFAEFNRFTNSPLANFHGQIYNLPFNMNTFHQMWGIVTPEEAEQIINAQREEYAFVQPKNLEEKAIQLVGRDIFCKLIKGYTEKQWGRPCSELPLSIIQRIPVRFSYDNNYFESAYQGVPIKGYTSLCESLLAGVEVRTNIDFLEDKERWIKKSDLVIFTGTIDSYFDYCFGPLEYRSVRFESEKMDIDNFQGNAVVNFTDLETPWTRIIEHKWFNFGKDSNGNVVHGTVVSKEFSQEWHTGIEPFYPISDEKNTKLYQAYRKEADNLENVVFGGRLGEYQYYDMDQTVASALSLAKQIINR